MDQKTSHFADYAPPALLLDRLGCRASLGLAAALLLAVAGVDQASGHALSQSPLYLAPIAIAAWAGGARWGLAAAALASLSGLAGAGWLAGGDRLHVWELVSMAGGFVLVVWLVAHLRQALGQADQRFVRMLEGLRAAIYVVDEERQTLLYANPEMQRLDGRLATIGPRAFEAQFIREPGGGDGDEKAAAADSGFVPEVLRHGPTGRWYQLQEAAIPWGRCRHVKLKVLSDVTPRKNAQMAREERRESQHQASRLSALAETASTLAHEINQPLTVIATYTDACQRLLQAPEVDHAEIIAVLGKCHAQAVRASAIVERLREFIRQRRHQPAPWPVGALIGEAVDVCRSLLEGAQISVDSGGVDAGLVVVADRILLVQLLVNLIRNAIDAMRATPAAQRRLTIAASPNAESGALISVADRGCGLPTPEAEELFAPFYTTKDDGLGLGLAICRSVAESHNGRLWAAANAAGGATFFLSIPAGPPAESAAA